MHFCPIARRGFSLSQGALDIRVESDLSLVSVCSGEAKRGNRAITLKAIRPPPAFFS